MEGFASLHNAVIGAGLCTYCGTCVAVCPEKAVALDTRLEEPCQGPRPCPPGCTLCSQTCPGKDIPLASLEQFAFGRERTQEEDLLGVARQFLKCHAISDEVRDGGSSGGFVSALLIHALESGIIDGAVVADFDHAQPWRVIPKIATTRQQVIEAVQSKQCVVPTNSILREAASKGMRLGVVGLPCHIHGIRKMQRNGTPKDLVDSIKFTVGLACSLNYNYRGTEHILEEVLNIRLENLKRLEFRHGHYPGKIAAWTTDGECRTTTHEQCWLFLLGHLRDRCRMCYDYTNELADVSAGDFIYSELRDDEVASGYTAVVVRSELGARLVEGAEKAGRIAIAPLDRENFLKGGFEWKKHGSAYQLNQRRKHGLATPDYHRPIDWPRPMPRPLPVKHPHLFGG